MAPRAGFADAPAGSEPAGEGDFTRPPSTGPGARENPDSAGEPSRIAGISHVPKRRDRVNEPASYELALTELDRLVQQMEGGQLPLDQLLDGYRRGADLLAYCRGRLQAVEEQVRLLDDGQLKAWTPPA